MQAHEFIFNAYYHNCSWKKIVFVLTSFALGAGIMALLGEF
jgi:zinc transporter 1/2/3